MSGKHSPYLTVEFRVEKDPLSWIAMIATLASVGYAGSLFTAGPHPAKEIFLACSTFVFLAGAMWELGSEHLERESARHLRQNKRSRRGLALADAVDSRKHSLAALLHLLGAVYAIGSFYVPVVS